MTPPPPCLSLPPTEDQDTDMAPSAADDYKAFILPVSNNGILLLYCTRKKSKGPHHQLPGGHVDSEDFDEAGELFCRFILYILSRTYIQDMLTVTFRNVSVKVNPNLTGKDHLLQACKIGAARELFEETGMDLRSTLDRLVPVQVRQSNDDEEEKLPCQYKNRIFFTVEISDQDFFTKVCTTALLPYLTALLLFKR
jgi:8-oxo-dGTP pyrophosphatase MutT (NUDIX family)